MGLNCSDTHFLTFKNRQVVAHHVVGLPWLRDPRRPRTGDVKQAAVVGLPNPHDRRRGRSDGLLSGRSRIREGRQRSHRTAEDLPYPATQSTELLGVVVIGLLHLTHTGLRLRRRFRP